MGGRAVECAHLRADNALDALDLGGERLLGAEGVHGHGTLLQLQRNLVAANLCSVSSACYHRAALAGRRSAPAEGLGRSNGLHCHPNLMHRDKIWWHKRMQL